MAAQDTSPYALIPEGQNLKIGVAVDLSQSSVAVGLDIAQAVDLAVSQFNARPENGLHGFQVEAIIQDDLCSREGGEMVAQEFAADPTLVAVVGHQCSEATLAALEVYRQARIPIISPSAAAGNLTQRNVDILNRVVVNEDIQAAVSARYVFQVLKAERVLVINNGSSYGRGLGQAFAGAYLEQGGQVLRTITLDPTAASYQELLAPLANLEFDLIYFAGYSAEAAILVQDLAALGLRERPFFAGDGIFNQSFLDFAGPAADGVYVTFGLLRTSNNLVAYDRFSYDYEVAYGSRPTDLGNYHALAYDAANMILAALPNAALLNVEGALEIDREILIQSLRGTRNFLGVSGTMSCDKRGECGASEISLYIAYQGQWIKTGIPPNLQVGD
jgi:branched-chain amino acid transport system substrate-binding protein